MNYFILLGLPGSGKGTQANILANKLGIQHISCGELFRWHVINNTEFGQKAREFIAQGELTPDSAVCTMFLEYLSKEKPLIASVIEGFPRTIVQTIEFEAFLKTHQAKIDQAILLDVSRKELIYRITGRRICTKCGRDYNIYFKPPKNKGVCDFDNEPLQQRADDSEDIIDHRLNVYAQAEEAVIDYLASKALLTRVNGSQAIDTVAIDVRRSVLQHLSNTQPSQ